MIQSKRFVTVVMAMALVLVAATAAWSQRGDQAPGWLGVSIQAVTGDVRDALPRGTANGVLISNVQDGSPADKAGLKDGDVITRFNRRTVRATDDLIKAVRDAGAGSTVSIEYYRDGRQMRDRVTLGTQPKTMTYSDKGSKSGKEKVWIDENGARHELKDGKYKVIVREGNGEEPDVEVWNDEGDDQPAPEGMEKRRIVIKRPGDKDDDNDFMIWHGKQGAKLRDMMKGDRAFGMQGPHGMMLFSGERPKLGVMLMDLSDQLAAYFGAKDGGALVSEVVKGSPADKAGLKAGDVITKIDDEAVEDPDDVREEVRDADAGDHVKVEALRKGQLSTYDVVVEKSSAEWSVVTPEGSTGLFKRFSGDDQDFDFRAPTPDMRQFEFRGQGQDAMKSDLDALRKEIQELREEISKMKSQKP